MYEIYAFTAYMNKYVVYLDVEVMELASLLYHVSINKVLLEERLLNSTWFWFKITDFININPKDPAPSMLRTNTRLWLGV